MKDFKQNQKMHAEGKHYCSGKSVRKYAEGGSIDDDVRARAMKWLEAGSPAQPTGEVAKAPSAPVVRKSTPIENSVEYENKRESTSLANRYPEKRTPSKMIRDEAEIAQRPSLETKGAKLLKDSGIKIGYKRGGKVKRGCK